MSKTYANKREVVVVDRGWIFAGNVTSNDTYIELNQAVWLLRWESIGFNGVLENPKNSLVDIRPMSTPIKIPHGSVIFSCPVDDAWGI